MPGATLFKMENTGYNKAYAIMLPFMTKKVLIINGVAFRWIEIDIENKKKGSTSHTQTVS